VKERLISWASPRRHGDEETLYFWKRGSLGRCTDEQGLSLLGTRSTIGSCLEGDLNGGAG
jgi:hypothetical protein